MDTTGNNPTIAVLFDFENITKSFRQRMLNPERFSMEAGFDDLISRITTQVGKVAMFCLFVPDYLVRKGKISKKELEFFQKRNFFVILCPKMGSKNEDTSDFNVIRWGLEIMLPYFSDITHLCIGSGDVDFLELSEKVKGQGLKIMVTMGSNMSLSKDMRKVVDTNPKTGEKMIYLFNPIIKQ